MKSDNLFCVSNEPRRSRRSERWETSIPSLLLRSRLSGRRGHKSARTYRQIIITTAASLFINCIVRRPGKRSLDSIIAVRSFVFNVTTARRRLRAGHYEFVRTWFYEKERSTTTTTTTTTCRRGLSSLCLRALVAQGDAR